MVILLAMSFAVTGCANNPATGIAFCDVASPILVDEKDRLTDNTAKCILTHNLIGRRICAW